MDQLIVTPPADDIFKERHDSIAFIDLEASGLGPQSWPIEVGWAIGDARPQSQLIQPDVTWREESWEPSAEALHQISIGKLKKNGSKPPDLCNLLNDKLTGHKVYSDAPDWDAFWLSRLFQAAKVRQKFSLHSMADLINPMIQGREEAVLAQADSLAPTRHRAAEDVVYLQTLYRLARENQR